MYSKLEDEVLELVNEIRTNPTFLVDDINEMLYHFNGKNFY